MKYYINFIFIFALMVLFDAFPAQAKSQPQLFLSDNARDTFKIADIYWLPDYLKDNLDRNTSGSNPGGSDDLVSTKCSTYGFKDSFDSTRYLCDIKRPKPGMTCYTNCRCKPTIIPGVGEECDITCGSACVKSKCKPAVTFTNPNDRCTQKCAQDQNVCTAKTCDSKCASGTSLTCTGPVSGNDGCGQSCKRCCDQNCPTGTSEANPGGCGGSTQNGCGTKTCYYPYKACCTEACPSGTTETNPGGCGGSTKNGCGTKTCYYAYRACCDNSGSESCSSNQFADGFTNGCGNYRYTCFNYRYEAICTPNPCFYVSMGGNSTGGSYSKYIARSAKSRVTYYYNKNGSLAKTETWNGNGNSEYYTDSWTMDQCNASAGYPGGGSSCGSGYAY